MTPELREPAVVFGLLVSGFLLIIALAAAIEWWRTRWERRRPRLVDPCPPPFYADDKKDG